ncbi:MAG: ABC transporter substrate-binding protein [Oligoflexia bacterium]|nr:ABC transporter substrate-binding protein [Oligoflexia bacterium]MBF0366279.1 ABC transporter substrate-binding protein [Oligoflexia bacterium]
MNLPGLVVFAENGVSNGEIVIGMSNALSGSAKGLGLGVKNGAMAYFEKINKTGGIHGRKIRVVSYDDEYEPQLARKNTKKLIDEDKIFALFGYVGTPTSKTVISYISQVGVPFIAPFTGAQFLRTPINKNVYNVRASYFDETELLVNRIVNDLGIKEIGIFMQNDGYGAAGHDGVVRALKKIDLKQVGVGKYKRNTLEVQEGLDELKRSQAKAVIMIGAYKACAAFMKLAKAQGFTPKMFNISFVGVDELYKEAGEAADGSFVSQVVPNFYDDSMELIKQYQKDVISDFSFPSLEGYIDAIVIVEGLKQAGSDLTRENFKNAMKKINLNIGGLQINFTGKINQALNKVYLTKLTGGKIVTVEKLN